LLGKYRVEGVIGEGGMGAVVKAWHLDLEESVAMKILLPDMLDRPEIVARFVREAKAAVKLKGEHVARVLDVGRLEADADGQFEGTPYIVMEYLEGADLNQIIKAHGPQQASLAVDLMLQACEAIAEAHSIGIIHRDIKASNFFVSQIEDQPPSLKILDFGIATPPKGTSDLTDGESVIGTPSYMAPEQMRSSRQADARSDIWSMGVVLYEMLEGQKPFRSEAYSDLCLKVGMDPPEPMVNPNTPEALRAVVMKCLEKPIERRYQSVAELAFDLMAFASDPVLARASVEQTARLLSRRATRSFDASRAPDDLTPAPGPGPKRLTPPANIPVQSTPISSSNPKLTPAGGVPQHHTPTGNGQIRLPTAGAPTPRKRGIVMGVSFLAALALAGGGAMLFSGGSDEPAAAARPDDKVDEPPAPNTEEPAHEAGSATTTPPTTTPTTMPPTTDTVQPDSAGSATTPAVGSAGSAAGSAADDKKIEKKIVKKKGPAGGGNRVIKKVPDDPFNRR